MKRVVGLVLVMLLLPITPVLAVDLDEILERSGEASYTAEQLITCTTPDGTRNAFIQLKQSQGEIRYSAVNESDVEVSSGFGGWALQSGGTRIEPKTAGEAELAVAEVPTYIVDEGSSVTFLGRPATSYELQRDGIARAQLVVDDGIGVLVSVTSFDADGAVYCQRRFISFDPTSPLWSSWSGTDIEAIENSEAATLPDQLNGFRRLDFYQDESGLSFAYYSDGFFSFAVFQSTSQVILDDVTTYELDGSEYQRQFNPGQVTYTWAVRDGWMALTGDLPPDMHEAVLAGLEEPHEAGLWRRLWRRIFG